MELDKNLSSEDINLGKENVDYQILALLRIRAVSVFEYFISENKLDDLVQVYLGTSLYSRNENVIQLHMLNIITAYDNWDHENIDNLYKGLSEINKLIIDVKEEDIDFMSTTEIAHEIFADGNLNNVVGFNINEYPKFSISIVNKLLQGMCQINFSNPEQRVAIFHQRNYANNENYRQRVDQQLVKGREIQGFSPLTETETSLLVNLWGQNKKVDEIAQIMESKPKRIRYYIDKLLKENKIQQRQIHKPWTDEETNKARELRQNGHTIPEIAQALSRPEGSVATKLVNIGEVTFYRNIWGKEEEERFLQLLNEEYSYETVLEKLSSEFANNRTKQQIISKANSMGLRIKTEFEIKRNRFEELVNNGTSQAEIAKLLEINYTTTVRWKRILEGKKPR